MFAAFLLLFGTPVLIAGISLLIILYISPLFGIAFALLATVVWGGYIGVRIFNNVFR